jgi:hypothetical protein
MLNDSKSRFTSPLFTNFLNIRAFLILYLLGIIALIANAFYSNDPDNVQFITLTQIVIFLVIAPAIYLATNKIFNEFKNLFELETSKIKEWRVQAGFPQSEVSYLFSKRSDFERFKDHIIQMLKNRKEKYFSIGLTYGLGIPIILLSNYQRGFLQITLNNPLSIASIQEYYWIIYWCLIYSLFISICWTIITILRALHKLNQEKPNLHITQTINELREACTQESPKKQKDKVESLDVSFRRFKAGLAPLANFALSFSLLFAIIGSVITVWAVFYFLITKNIDLVWYGTSFAWFAIGITFFILGQFDAWKLWSGAKKDSIELLNLLCLKKTETSFDIDSKNKKKITEKYLDAEYIAKFSENIAQISSVTYTSSSIYKVAAVYALAFGPIIIDEAIKFAFLK